MLKVLQITIIGLTFFTISCAAPEAKTFEAPQKPTAPEVQKKATLESPKPVAKVTATTIPALIKEKPLIAAKVEAQKEVKTFAKNDVKEASASKAPTKKITKPSTLKAPPPDPVVDTSKFNVLKYFNILYPKEQKKPFEDIVFQKKDVKNGYLHITGKYLGHYVFKMFRGQKADFLLEQAVSCAPECEQENTVFNFVNGEIEDDKELDQYFPKSVVERHIKAVTKYLPKKSEDDEEREAWYQVSETSNTIQVLVVDQNPGLPVRGKVNVYEVGELTWNGTKFDFKALNPSKSSEIKITDLK
jgi:hypothetical protein